MMLSVSRQFQHAILGCPLIRDKMFLNRSINPRETWRIVRGGHAGAHFQSVGHWLFLHRPQDPAGEMFQALAPFEPHPRFAFTPAVLHPIFLNGPWDDDSRKEALRAAPGLWLRGAQRWVPATMLPVTFETARGNLLNAWTSDPPCLEADVRVSFLTDSKVWTSKFTSTSRIKSATGLRLRDVYDALRKLNRKLRRKAKCEGTRVKRELRIFTPYGIHPVTTQEWDHVVSLQGES